VKFIYIQRLQHREKHLDSPQFNRVRNYKWKYKYRIDLKCISPSKMKPMFYIVCRRGEVIYRCLGRMKRKVKRIEITIRH
jgi:hypothetical protein